MQEPTMIGMTGELGPKMVYLAGPIDTVSREDAKLWRTEAENRLQFCGIGAFNPVAAFSAPSKSFAHMIESINRLAIRHSFGLLVYILPTQHGFGTIREIEYARSMGKPVFIIAPHFMNSFSGQDLIFCTEIREAVEKIRDYEMDRMKRSLEQFRNGPIMVPVDTHIEFLRQPYETPAHPSTEPSENA